MSFTNSGARLVRSRLGIAVSLALCVIASSAVAQQGRTAVDHVVVPRGVYAGNEPGVTLVHDYGSFQLWAVDAAHGVELRHVAGDAVSFAKDTLEFDAVTFDPQVATPDIPEAFRRGKPEGRSLEIVQFAGPIADEWLAEIERSGAVRIQYIPNHAYVYAVEGGVERAALARLPGQSKYVSAVLPYEPYYKLDHALAARARAGLGAGKPVKLSVLVAKLPGNDDAKRSVQALARTVEADWTSLGAYEWTIVTADEAAVAALAQIPEVVAVGERVDPRRYDEVQNQIIAGNLIADRSGPTGPGYLAWLQGQGFSTNPTDYPMVDIADDGLGNGNASQAGGDVTLRVGGLAAGASRVLIANNCTTDALGDGRAGHGHINTSIVGGFDGRSGFPFLDPLGYQRGQGVNPYARLGHTKIFTNAGGYNVSNCSNTDAGVIKRQQDGGALISSNSWGAGVAGDYDISALAYDLGTRDADTGEGGLQPMIFVFAAGNDGAGASTVGTPGSAKNVLTVGASENQRQSDESGSWTDGCGAVPGDANNAMDVVGFSSRGPVEGARVKPEIIAPGTHIQGTASTNAGFDGTGVCDQYRPGGQTTFAASSGTSHSTPAIAGAASLVYRFLQTEYGVTAPSVALVKAYFMAHPTYLTGASANDNLPSNAQGFGMPNLGTAFDRTTLRDVVEQSAGNTFGTTGGANFVYSGSVADTGKPLRIALAWSDAGGPVNATPQVNNLNLEVDAGGQTYRGNRFTGQFSNTTATADTANNYEAVFLPAGTSGPITVRVIPANIAGDGVPGNADTTDQDFALVCSNCADTPDFTLDATPYSRTTCGAAGATWTVALGAVNGFASGVTLATTGAPAGATSSFAPASPTPPTGSTLTLGTGAIATGSYVFNVTGTNGATTHTDTIALTHAAAAPAAPALVSPTSGAALSTLTPTLTWSAAAEATSYVVEVDDDSAFGSINYTATVTGTSHTVATALNATTTYYWRIRGTNTGCGAGTNSAVRLFVTAQLTCQTFTSTDVPKAIPDNAPAGVSSVLTSTLTGTIADVDVLGLVGTHTWINDLSVHLARPDATSVNVMARSCTNQDNFNLNLDDAAVGSPGGWPCPPTGGGTYRPSNPLSGLNGTAANGTWTLRVQDHAGLDTGSLTGWGLRICAGSPVSGPTAVDDTYAATEDTQLVVAAATGVLGNDSGSSLTAAVVTAPPAAQGALALASNGSFTFDPAPNFCGAAAFTYSATSGALSDEGAVTINVACVNDAPAGTADAYVANEDAPLVQAAPGVLANDTDVEGTALTAINVSTPARGAVSLQTNGGFTYTPTANLCGADSFTYQARDGAANSAATAVSLDVTCIDDLAVANDDAPAAVLEDAATATFAVLANDSDVENDAFVVTGVTQPAAGGVSAVGPLGANVTLTPSANYCGAAGFGYTITGGDTANVAASVTCVNDAPSFTAGANQAVAENAGAQSVSGWATAIATGPANESAQAVSFEIVSNTNTALLSAGPAVASNGALTYTPATDAFGVATIQIRARDDGGTANGGVDASPAQTFTITVNENLAAVANDDTPAAVLEDSGATTIAVLGNDSDAEADPFVVTQVTQPANGTAAVGPAGANVTFTPAANFCGATSFGYTVTGGDTASVNVTVTCVNDAPAFTAGANQSVNENLGAQSVPGWATAISAGPANESGQVVSFEIVSNSNPALFSAAPAVASNGTLSYTSATDAFGTATIQVRAIDDGGGATNASPAQSFTITVVDVVNQASVANDDAPAAVLEDSGTTTIAVLGNDSDAESDPFVVTAVTQPANGTAAIGPAGANVTFTPAADFCGATSFGYTITGGDTATVNVTVTCVNDGPVLNDRTVTIVAGAANGTLLAALAALDVDSSGLTYALTGGNTGGAFSINPTSGTVTVATSGAVTGTTFTLTITVSDGTLDDTATITVNVLQGAIFADGFE